MTPLAIRAALIVGLLLSCQNTFSGPVQDCEKSWTEIADAWQAFTHNNSSSSRKRLLQALPSKEHPLSHQCEKAKATAETVSRGLPAIQASLQKKDPESVLIAMRIKNVVFGPTLNAEATEILNELLGNSVVHSPKLFLQAVEKETQDKTCPYADHTSETQKEDEELPKRIRALESVKDESLKATRALCIESVRKKLHSKNASTNEQSCAQEGMSAGGSTLSSM
jgi:hypothetical protein